MSDIYGNENRDNYENGQQYGRQYDRPPMQQPPYGGYPPQYDPRDEPVRMSEWLVAIIVGMIPFVNIIMAFVWAFSSKTKTSKANYFKAYLIIMAAELILLILLAIFYMAMLVVVL